MKETHDCRWAAGLPRPPQAHTRSERRDAREHRQKILEVAQQLFAEQGVDAISMHQIAQAAGIGQGTLYRRYSHKGDLCRDLLQERRERFMEELAALFSTTASAGALTRLVGVLKHMIAFLEEDGPLLGPVAQAALRELPCGEPMLPQSFASQASPFAWLRGLFIALLTEAIQKEEIAPLDIEYTVDTLLFALYPPFYRYQRQERGLSPERILQGLCHLYVDGLKRPPGNLQ